MGHQSNSQNIWSFTLTIINRSFIPVYQKWKQNSEGSKKALKNWEYLKKLCPKKSPSNLNQNLKNFYYSYKKMQCFNIIILIFYWPKMVQVMIRLVEWIIQNVC